MFIVRDLGSVERRFQVAQDGGKHSGLLGVCRRPVRGRNAVLAILSALHQCVPPQVQFHLFGVKSAALAVAIAAFPSRIASMDSMAWRMAARWAAHHSGIKSTPASKAAIMAAWYLRQLTLSQPQPSPQLSLL